MKTNSNPLMIRITTMLSMAGAIGLLLWWFIMPLLLPVKDAVVHFERMIQDPHWIPVNLMGLVATLLVTLGFPMFFIQKKSVPDRIGHAGLMVAFSGLILFTCIQYYETIIWPAVAATHPELVNLEGALVKGDSGVVYGLLISGVVMGAGYLMLGISLLRNKNLPRAPLWMLLSGAPVFANGIVFPVRTVGLLLFCSGTIWLAIHLKNQQHPDNHRS